MSKTNSTEYILITPAKNEAKYIENTIISVISQTIKPIKWVIVSDGSTDGTDEIVEKYAEKYPFMELVHLENNGQRNFAAKVMAINEGFKRVQNINYDFYGNLDADISFSPNYYEQILEKFHENPTLGIAAGIIFEKNGGNQFVPQIVSKDWSAPGALQMFRRECFEDIGGYVPLKKGGIDTIAEVMARMYGWQVRSYASITAFHYKRMGTKERNIYTAKYLQGQMEYSHGNHPLFMIVKCLFRFREKPFVVGSILRLLGFFKCYVRREQRAVTMNVIKFLRREQLKRLKSMFIKIQKPNFSVDRTGAVQFQKTLPGRVNIPD